MSVKLELGVCVCVHVKQCLLAVLFKVNVATGDTEY